MKNSQPSLLHYLRRKVKTASISSNASQSTYSFLKAIYEFKIKQRKLNNGDRWKNISDEENWIIESDPRLSISSAKIGKWNWNKYITLHPEVRSKARYSLFVYSAREIDIEKRGKKGTFTFFNRSVFPYLGIDWYTLEIVILEFHICMHSCTLVQTKRRAELLHFFFQFFVFFFFRYFLFYFIFSSLTFDSGEGLPTKMTQLMKT